MSGIVELFLGDLNLVFGMLCLFQLTISQVFKRKLKES